MDSDPLYIDFWIEAADGLGEVYEGIQIIRTAASNLDDQRSKVARLDYSNYEEVAEYYELSDEDVCVSLRSKGRTASSNKINSQLRVIR